MVEKKPESQLAYCKYSEIKYIPWQNVCTIHTLVDMPSNAFKIFGQREKACVHVPHPDTQGLGTEHW